VKAAEKPARPPQGLGADRASYASTIIGVHSALDLDSESLVSEVRKLRGKKNPLSLAAHRSLKEEHARTILPAQALAREALALERQISNLVNASYGLTPEEVRSMWNTAPPRMPIAAMTVR
jgi:hypothetical protein